VPFPPRGGYDHEGLVTLLSRLRQTIKSVVFCLGDRVVESVEEDSKRGDREQVRDTFFQMIMGE
jgi:hypothetical protein